MARITLDPDRIIGPVKPLHGGGQPPLTTDLVSGYPIIEKIGAPYARLHDVGGRFGGGCFVDIPNLFRNFDADENDPSSYDFTFTDRLLIGLIKSGIEPYFRLGVTIENSAFIKRYTTNPPSDFGKWARICEHIMRHYLEGWANGFHHAITYWEIWNEPECFCGAPDGSIFNQMWSGTAEQYYELYDVTAKHLKASFPYAKIGGYASCGFYNLTANWDIDAARAARHHFAYDKQDAFFHGFFRYIRENGSPIDFFSWHSYADTHDTLIWADYLEKKLVEFGYAGLPTHLNEWNPCHLETGTAHHGAEVASMMLAMQKKSAVALMCIYDMRISGEYAPLFDMHRRPTYAWHALASFNRLYRLGTEFEAVSDTKGLYAVAAKRGDNHALMISNLTGGTLELSIEGADLSGASINLMDETQLMSPCTRYNRLPANGVLLIEW